MGSCREFPHKCLDYARDDLLLIIALLWLFDASATLGFSKQTTPFALEVLNSCFTPHITTQKNWLTSMKYDETPYDSFISLLHPPPTTSGTPYTANPSTPTSNFWLSKARDKRSQLFQGWHNLHQANCWNYQGHQDTLQVPGTGNATGFLSLANSTVLSWWVRNQYHFLMFGLFLKWASIHWRTLRIPLYTSPSYHEKCVMMMRLDVGSH